MSLQVLVDWADSGDFAGAHDDITADVMRASWRLGARKAYQTVADESVLDLTLHNAGDKYTPENTSSPLSGLMLPGRRVVVRIDGKPMFTGFIEFPQVRWNTGDAGFDVLYATISGYGAKRLLEQREITTGFLQDVRSGAVVEQALIEAGIIETSGRPWLLGVEGSSNLGSSTFLARVDAFGLVDEGKLVFDQFGDAGRRPALDVIEAATVAERGKFWFARDGAAVWWDRHRSLMPADVSGVVDFASDPRPARADYTYGGDIYNAVRVTVNPAGTLVETTLWQLDEALTVGAGLVEDIEVRLRRDTGQFAGGVNLTATPSFTAGAAAVEVVERGGVAAIRIDNTAGTVAAVLDGLTLSGTPVTRQNSFSVTAIDSASIARFGRRELNIDLGEAGQANDAKGVAGFEVAQRSEARGVVSALQWRGVLDERFDKLIDPWGLGARLRVELARIGHNEAYTVIGEAHQWSAGGKQYEATFYLEPAVRGEFWLLGVTGNSELGVNTRLGY